MVFPLRKRLVQDLVCQTALYSRVAASAALTMTYLSRELVAIVSSHFLEFVFTAETLAQESLSGGQQAGSVLLFNSCRLFAIFVTVCV